MPPMDNISVFIAFQEFFLRICQSHICAITITTTSWSVIEPVFLSVVLMMTEMMSTVLIKTISATNRGLKPYTVMYLGRTLL